MDLQPHGEHRWGLTRRFPLSPISAIIPFNFPVLLAAHKLAPAIACGATMILKAPPQDPLATLLLGEIVGDYLFQGRELLPHRRPARWDRVVPRSAALPPATLQDPRALFSVVLDPAALG
jgi:hypothetical protein